MAIKTPMAVPMIWLLASADRICCLRASVLSTAGPRMRCSSMLARTRRGRRGSRTSLSPGLRDPEADRDVTFTETECDQRRITSWGWRQQAISASKMPTGFVRPE